MRVVVLGAGVVGVAAAWYLAAAGHEVTVIDRAEGPARETSFANGGQVSVSYAEPWANPGAPRKLLKWLGREDAPLLFRLRADARQWRWGVQFLLECLPARTRRNTLQCLRLATYSRDCLRALLADVPIAYDGLQRGILQFYTDARDFEHDVAAAAYMRELGCDRVVKTPAECVAIEPALHACASRLAGGIYTASDGSGDAQRFTEGLAAHAATRGVSFRWRTPVIAIDTAGDGVRGVRVNDGATGETSVQADAYVVALGSDSPLALRPIGVPCLVYPVKGYSATIPVREAASAPYVSLTDIERKIVITRLGQRLRVAGTAELNGYDTSLNDVRCRALVDRIFGLFPEVGDRAGITLWAGLRPATPSNVPLLGRTRYRNLFLDTGHGTLGWTMACGSGRAIADIVSGRRPEVDFRFT
jgi:D-amino-acid dehydrogenase